MQESQIQAIRHFNRLYTQKLGLLKKNVFNSEISWAEARILMEISEIETPTLVIISKNLELDKSYVSRVIQKLSGLKYLTKQASPSDKRAKILALTSIGQSVVDQLNQESDDQINLMLPNLSQPEQDAFYQAVMNLEKLLD
ncbi:MarR family winged helix-turn-helix transcriptional regulator [Apilactobacillus apinorum]|uniref:HTH marR-type domain-containing protein n=1 Tax=Apilactobacillus apinorum TaxID=1218495 RepID=A0ABP9ZG36_9LACO